MKRKLQTLVLILMVPTLLVGCSWRAFWTTLGVLGAAGAGAATVYYLQGRLKADVKTDLNKTYEASLAAVEERGWSVGDAKIGVNDAKITGRTAGADGDNSYTIDMSRGEADNTEVGIRIGTMGDEAISRAMFYDIQKKVDPAGEGTTATGTSETTRPGETVTDTRSSTPSTTTTRTTTTSTAGVEPQAIAPPRPSDVGVTSD